MAFFRLSIFVPMDRGHVSKPLIVTKEKKKNNTLAFILLSSFLFVCVCFGGFFMFIVP